MKRNSREDMIKATAYLLQSKGYFGTGLNDIIKLSGAPKGSIYYHFPNGKEQLAKEAIEWTKHSVSQFIAEKLKDYSDPTEAIQHYILDSAERFEKDSYFQGVPITAIVLETSDVSEELREACRSVFDAWHHIFADKLLNYGYEPRAAYEIAMTVNAMIQGALVICLTRNDSTPLKIVAEVIPPLLKT
ncbi:TetR/AcrR family transcriptional regulator [Salipaludibacillus agaradhaerens]|uniref:TetR/AcrR family transcriptional regulator n=1 Tax=Salipaludibacillus agaradhaerens TaxID=76935 RepID=UPI000998A97C|nr:TetR/AcrR family transcriptional regulator [Salipaludibacillus agaradhaerens]